jgi:hypothetical protein
MVDVKTKYDANDVHYLEVTGERSGAKYYIRKNPKGPLYYIATDKKLPEKLKVQFTSEAKAEDYLVKFLKTKKMTDIQRAKVRYDKNHGKVPKQASS